LSEIANTKKLSGMIKNISLSFIILLSLFFTCNSQTSSDYKANSIYTSAGFGGIYGILNLNYERIKPFDKIDAFYQIRGSFGTYGLWEEAGENYLLTTGIIWGKNNHHFESNAGITVFYDRNGYELAEENFDDPMLRLGPTLNKSDYTKIQPSIAAGYRYQNMQKPFIFRCGLGYPEALFISLGWAFGKKD